MATAATTARPELYAGMPQGWTVQDSLTDSYGAGDQNLVSSSGATGALTGNNRSGFIAQSYELEAAVAGTTALTAGTVYGTKLIVKDPVTSTYGWLFPTVAAITPTHGWVGLLDAVGNVVAQSADLLTLYFLSTGPTAVAWTTPVALNGGVYQVITVQVGAGTSPKFATSSGLGAATNANTSAGTGNLNYFTCASGVAAAGSGATSWATKVVTSNPLNPLTSSETADSGIQAWAAIS